MKTKNIIFKLVFAFFLSLIFSLLNASNLNDITSAMKSDVFVDKINLNTPIDRIDFYKQSTDCSTIVTDIDGNVYKTVTIVAQVWLAENLKTTHYSNGTAIRLVNNQISWDSLAVNDKAYCWYIDDELNLR